MMTEQRKSDLGYLRLASVTLQRYLQGSLLETSLFTRVVYPQYMEQLIVWYFSSFSVNLHSLMFY